jgi:hypothetical protein
MFTEIKHSIGELDEDELSLANSVLDGEDWEELLGEHPPAWLVKWSKRWKEIPLYSIDSGSDPMFSTGSIWCDGASGECWFRDEGCEEPPCLEKIPSPGAKPSAAAVCETVFTYMRETFGEFPLMGNFEVFNRRLLPRGRMEAFLSSLMREYGISSMETNPELSLGDWLDREYPRPARSQRRPS